MPRLSSPLRCFALFLASHPVTLSRWCLYIFQSNSHKYLEAAALPTQALTGANRARSGCVLQASLLYIATTCTHFQLCRFLNLCDVCACVDARVFCGPLKIPFQLPRICERKVTLHSLLLCSMRVCMWENVYSLCDMREWPVTLVNKQKKDLCANAKVWKQSNQTFVQETHFVTYL